MAAVSAELREITAEPLGEGMIEMLEEIMAEVREGRISSLAVAQVYRDGTTCARWSHLPSYGMMLGAVTRLLHRINLRMDG